MLRIGVPQGKVLAETLLLLRNRLLCRLGTFPVITSQAEPGEMQRTVEDVLRDFFRGKELCGLRGNFLGEAMHGSSFIEIAR